MRIKVLLILAAVIAILFTIVRGCSKKDSVPTQEEETLTTIVTDTVPVDMEKRINSAIETAETTVKEVVKERDSAFLKIAELESIDRITVYDTVKVIIEVPSDSVILYNIFEYEFSDGLAVTSTRDTIQSTKVSRAFAQKFIIN